MKITIVFASKHGQTRTISEFLKRKFLLNSNNSVEIIDLNRRDDPISITEKNSVVIAGTPIYAGQFQSAVLRWIKRNKSQLTTARLAFFTVSLNAEDKHPQARFTDDQLLKDFISSAGLVPDFIASFSGALNFLEYSFVTRWMLKRISKKAGGPVDTSKDYEFTHWDHVAEFASSIESNDMTSQYSTKNRLPEQKNLNEVMPVFEHVWKSQIRIKGYPDECFWALNSLESKDLKLASILEHIRNIGQVKKIPKGQLFIDSTKKFGAVELFVNEPNEVISGLVGQLWRLSFGICNIEPQNFKSFNDLHYIKVATQMLFKIDADGEYSIAFFEMRMHATTEAAAKRFNIYWNLLRPGIHVYMRSFLSGIKKRAEKRAREWFIYPDFLKGK